MLLAGPEPASDLSVAFERPRGLAELEGGPEALRQERCGMQPPLHRQGRVFWHLVRHVPAKH